MTTPLNGSITLGQAPGTVDEIVRIADGAPIALREVSGGVTVENRMVLRVFDTGSGAVTATCPPTPGYTDVALGKRPDMTRLLGGPRSRSTPASATRG